MPIFRYYCEKCDDEFEKLLLSSRKENEVKCPDCKNKNVKKLITSPFINSGSREMAPVPPTCKARGGFG